MKNTPILDTLNNYSAKNPLRFHMPGHKGSGFSPVFSLDVTELKETDNLANPTGAIARAQELTAKLFGAKYSFFTVGGSSLGNLAMISALCPDGGKIIFDRQSHLSAFSALTVTGADPVYVGKAEEMPTAEETEQALKLHKDAKAVFLTTPNALGFTAQTKEIADLCAKHGIPLICDEAHGAHFSFHEELPMPALKAGASMCVQSFHKTLPALTQAAVIQLADMNRYDSLRRAITLYQTSSPSYLLTASLDYARAFMQEEGHGRLDTLIRTIKELAPPNVLMAENHDILKIVIQCDGVEGERILRENSIVPEMAGEDFVLCIASVCNSPQDIKKLFEAAAQLPCKKIVKRRIPQLKKAITPRAAYLSRSYITENPADCIAAAAVFRYPPGIPVIAPGEVISREAVEYIRERLALGDSFLGLEEGKFRVCAL